MLGRMWTSPDLEGGIKGLRPTTWGYNCAMEACARAGDWASALELMDEMSGHGGCGCGWAREGCFFFVWQNTQLLLDFFVGRGFLCDTGERAIFGDGCGATSPPCRLSFASVCSVRAAARSVRV